MLQIGAVAIIFVMVLLPYIPATVHSELPLLRRLRQLDWIGAFISLGAVAVFMIALQWGGNQKPWNDPSVIALLVLVRKIT